MHYVICPLDVSWFLENSSCSTKISLCYLSVMKKQNASNLRRKVTHVYAVISHCHFQRVEWKCILKCNCCVSSEILKSSAHIYSIDFIFLPFTFIFFFSSYNLIMPGCKIANKLIGKPASFRKQAFEIEKLRRSLDKKKFPRMASSPGIIGAARGVQETSSAIRSTTRTKFQSRDFFFFFWSASCTNKNNETVKEVSSNHIETWASEFFPTPSCPNS